MCIVALVAFLQTLLKDNSTIVFKLLIAIPVLGLTYLLAAFLDKKYPTK